MQEHGHLSNALAPPDIRSTPVGESVPASALLLDAAGVVCVDLPCPKCRYNLRGLPASGACPECSSPLELSLREEWVRFGPAEWVAKLRRGLLILAFSAPASVISQYWFVACALFIGPPIVVAAIDIGLAVMLLWGVVLCSSLELGSPSSSLRMCPDLRLRIAAAGWMCGKLVLLIAAWGWWWIIYSAAGAIFLLAWVLCIVVLHVAGMRRIRYHMHRARDADSAAIAAFLARGHCVTLLVTLPTCLFLATGALLDFEHFSTPLQYAFSGSAILAALGNYALLLLCVMTIDLLLRVRGTLGNGLCLDGEVWLRVADRTVWPSPPAADSAAR